MRRSFVILGILVGATAAIVVGLAMINAIPEAVLAPTAAALGVGITGVISILNANTSRREAEDRDKRQAEDAAAQKQTDARERARQVAIPLRQQFLDVAEILDSGTWPTGRELQLDFSPEDQKVLVSSLPTSWAFISRGVRALGEVSDAVQGKGDDRRIAADDENRVWLASENLKMAAEVLEDATLLDWQIEAERRKTMAMVEEIIPMLRERAQQT